MVLAAVHPVASTRAEEPCTDPADACVEELLDTFQPYLFFEDDGPDGLRVEYPTEFVRANDDTVEYNFEYLPSGPAYGVYRNALRLETTTAPCWLLQYHYYFPANWRPDIWEGDGYTHEHDWEWVYVFAGWSWRLERYAGYAVTLSSHDRDNIVAMMRLHTYLYPLVVLDPELPNDWVRNERRLWHWTEDEDLLLTRVAVVVAACGNALGPFKGDAQGLVEGGSPDWIAEVPATWRLGYAGSECERESDCENCYGDPHVCLLPFVCSGRDECGDCESERFVPWRRAGLWAPDCVPLGFQFPADLRTAVDPEPLAALPLEFEFGVHECRLTWQWPGGWIATPSGFELIARRASPLWRCELGSIPASSEKSALTVIVCDGSGALSAPSGLADAILVAPCLWAQERAGGWFEVWARRADSLRTLVARSCLPLPPVEADDSRTLQLTAVPRPTATGPILRFRLPHESTAWIELIDPTGREVSSCELGIRPAGWQSFIWHPRDVTGQLLPSGVYWVQLRACGLCARDRIWIIR